MERGATRLTADVDVAIRRPRGPAALDNVQVAARARGEQPLGPFLHCAPRNTTLNSAAGQQQRRTLRWYQTSNRCDSGSGGDGG